MLSYPSLTPRRIAATAGTLSRQAEESLHHPDAGMRVAAVQLLTKMGAMGLAGIEHALHDESPAVRARAVEALGQHSPCVVVPMLKDALRDGDAHVRIAAATTLGTLGGEAHPAIPQLVRSLADVNMIFSRLAAQALSRIGRRAVRALIAALLNPDSNVRREAAWALGQIGPAAAEALPALEAALASTNPTPVPTPSVSDHTVVFIVVAKSPSQANGEARVRAAVSRAIDRIRSVDDGSL